MRDLETHIARVEQQVLDFLGLRPDEGDTAEATIHRMTNPVTASLAKKAWNEALHPRGKDGRFIEKAGFVKGLFNWMDGADKDSPRGKGIKKKASRVKVLGFSSKDGASADNPWVKVAYDGPDPELQNKVGFARSNELTQVSATKGRLDGNTPNLPDAPDAPDAPDVDAPDAPDMPDAPDAPDISFDGFQDVEAGSISPLDELILPGDIPGVVMDFKFSQNMPDYILVHTDNGSWAGKMSDRVKVRRKKDRDALGATPDTPVGTGKQSFRDRADAPDVDLDKPGAPTVPSKEWADKQLDPDVPFIETEDPAEAVRLLFDGKKVELRSRAQTTVVLDRLRQEVDLAKQQGKDAPPINLCNVMVKGVSVFCADNKGIPRIKMPQLSGKPIPGTKADDLPKDRRGNVDLMGRFRTHLEDRGISVTNTTEVAAKLKASQNELNGAKVAGIANAMVTGDYDAPEGGIFVSNDNYVVDGHHRWAATLGNDLADGIEDTHMDIARIDMPILDLLAEAVRFGDEWGIRRADASK